MNSLSRATHPAVLRYAKGELTAAEAADLMGGDATVHDVVHQLRQAGLSRPRRGVDQVAIDRALQMFRTPQ